MAALRKDTSTVLPRTIDLSTAGRLGAGCTSSFNDIGLWQGIEYHPQGFLAWICKASPCLTGTGNLCERMIILLQNAQSFHEFGTMKSRDDS